MRRYLLDSLPPEPNAAGPDAPTAAAPTGPDDEEGWQRWVDTFAATTSVLCGAHGDSGFGMSRAHEEARMRRMVPHGQHHSRPLRVPRPAGGRRRTDRRDARASSAPAAGGALRGGVRRRGADITGSRRSHLDAAPALRRPRRRRGGRGRAGPAGADQSTASVAHHVTGSAATRAVARGVAAGLAGTTVMTGTLKLEQLARRNTDGPVDYDASSHVVTAAGRALGHDPRTSAGRSALFLLVHWGYGSAFAGVYPALRSRLPRRLALAAFWAAGQTMAMTLFPTLGGTPPPWRWRRSLLVSSFAQHAVYAVTVDAAYRALSPDSPTA